MGHLAWMRFQQESMASRSGMSDSSLRRHKSQSRKAARFLSRLSMARSPDESWFATGCLSGMIGFHVPNSLPARPDNDLQLRCFYGFGGAIGRLGGSLRAKKARL